MVLLRLDGVLGDVVAGDDEEFVLVVEDHAECDVLYVDECQVSSVCIEDLNAFHVADVYSAISIHCDRIRRSKLTLLIASAAKTIHKLPVASELEDRIVESTERVDITRSIHRDSHAQLRVAAGAADRCGNGPYNFAV